MSLFEIVMLVCFGAAWPFSIYKSWNSRRTSGKSVFFLYIVIVGYVAGILNKIYNHFDGVVYLYGLNACMVATDIVLYYRNRAIERREAPRPS
jgi:hypothetical protein